ncbi:MAG: peptidase M1 [Polyangiaceae bacterium]|nr:peptidase M1 [Polyangiaceae bacterium]
MEKLVSSLVASLSILVLTGCDGAQDPKPGPVPIAPSMDTSRDILSTNLALDVTAMTGEATIVLAGSESTGASLEVPGLSVTSVASPDSTLPIQYAVQDGRLDVGVPESSDPIELRISYSFATQSNFDGYLAEKLTFLWPRFCGNLFPCKSAPSEGVSFTMQLSGIPMGDTAVFPAEIPSDAPTYMPAFALGNYTYVMLGKTTAGTEVGVYHLPGEEAAMMEGTKDLTAFFDWLEKTYGEYTFGGKVASVSANWGPGAYGGMEHHPYWHIARDAMNDPVTHAHEAAHGWFGDGVRIACWEDFVLSEGTVSYLAARAIEAVGGTTAGQAVWDGYQSELDAVLPTEDTILMLDTCNEIDLIVHPLWSNVTYMKGAFFFKAVEAQVGRDKLDAAIKKFYGTHKNAAARMQDMIDTIQAETGADISVHVNGWLKGMGKP